MTAFRSSLVASSLLLVLAASSARAQLLNPSFEEGTDPGGDTLVLHGSTAITGWTVSGDVVTYGGTDWAAEQGTRSVGLYSALRAWPGFTSAIAQRFPTVPGDLYDDRAR